MVNFVEALNEYDRRRKLATSMICRNVGTRCIDDVWHEVDLKISMRGLGSYNLALADKELGR